MKNEGPINILIPMAGLGSRFVKVGITTPKPFLMINNKTLIHHVIENLSVQNAHYILIVRKEHFESYSNELNFALQGRHSTIIQIDNITEGAAMTVLYAHRLINNDMPLLIANSDQIVDIAISDFISDCYRRKLDGSILTFMDKNRDPKWSFASINENGLVKEVKEKVPISDFATVGIYLFSKGRYFVEAALDMIVRNDRVNNEFYVCPVYNYLIKDGKKIGIYNIDENKMHGVGTPDDFFLYKKLVELR